MKIKIKKWLAEKHNLPIKTIEADLEHETEKAYLIVYKTKEIWLPKTTRKGETLTKVIQ